MIKRQEIKTKYRQRLPHIQPIGAAFFVTFRLEGSIPKSEIKKLNDNYDKLKNNAHRIKDSNSRRELLFKLHKKWIVDIDILLDIIKDGPQYLKEPEVLKIVKDILHQFDNKLYELVAYTIMSNHIHILIDTSIQLTDTDVLDNEFGSYKPLNVIMKRIKAPIAQACNKYLGITGQFWARESFDMIIRNEKMYQNVISYILENPVKAGLVREWKDYNGNYLKYY